MDFFKPVGDFFGGLFGGKKKKKEEQPSRPQVTVRPPSAITSPNRPAPGVQSSNPFELNQQDQPGQPTALSLGGVKVSQPDPTQVAEAQKAIKSGGTGAPFKPEVIDAANKNIQKTAPVQAPQPVVKKPAPVNPKPLVPTQFNPTRPQINNPVIGKNPNPLLSMDIKTPQLNLISDADKATAAGIQAKGGDPSSFLKAAAIETKAKKEADFNNSFHGAAINFLKELVAAPVSLGGGFGTALASNSRAVKNADKAVQAGRNQDLNTIKQLNQRLADPNLDESSRQRITTYRDSLITAPPTVGEQKQADLYNEMAAKTDPLATVGNAVGTALLPAVGALEGAGAATFGGKLVKTIVDPLSLIEKIPKNNVIGRFLNTEISNLGRNQAGKKVNGELTREVIDQAPDGTNKPLAPDTQPTVVEPTPPTIEVNPGSPKVPTTSPALDTPAITSPNRPAPTVKAPEPLISRAETAGVQPGATINPPELQVPNKIRTPDEEVAAAQKAIDEAAVKAPEQPAPVEVVPTELPQAAQSRAMAEAATPVNPEAVAADAAKQAENAAPTQAIADELGTITRKAVTEGKIKNDGDAQVLAEDVGLAIEKAANDVGTTWEDINKKVQEAWSKGLKDYREAGLTKEQFDVAQKAASELSLLRQRVDPAIIGKGDIGQFYSPRQTPDTEFTQSLVNELSRDKTNGLRNNELDLSTRPYVHAIRRYANAETAMSEQLFHSLENKVVKDAAGNETLVPTGIKVPESVKASFKEDLKPYIKAQDDAIRAADMNDPQAIDAAVKAGDKAIDDALNKMAAKLPRNTQEARDAIGNMIAERRAYMQSTVRTNMFLNVVNRVFDQTQKAIVNLTDQAVPLATKASSKMFGALKDERPGIATDRLSRSLARKYSKGTLIRQQNRNFMTNVRLAGANARNPATKTLAKADAAYRSAGTYLTSLGDLSTNAVKATNLAILAKGRAEGLKTADELEAYLVKNLQTPEYLDIYHNMSNNYAGYIGMPQTLTSTGVKGDKVSEFMSKIDNFTKNALDKTPLPDRIKQEINDLIMPSITGFAGATSRVAGKQLNALTLGIPNMVRGLRLAASDSPNAKAIGQMMVSRSIVDAVAGGGVAGGGMLLGATGHWTGGYPEDPNERARWEKEGITPNSFSFNVGDKTVYIQPGRILGVLALPMVLPAVSANAIANGTDPQAAVEEVVSGTIGQFNENLGADALISHIGDVDSIINNKQDSEQAKKNLLNMLGYSMSNVVPASGLQNNVAAATDPYKRDTGGDLGNIVKNRNPFTRQSLDVKTDNLGNPIKNNSQLTLGSSAITVGDGQAPQPTANKDGSPNLDSEINRLAQAKFETVPARDVKNKNSQTDAKTLMLSPLYQGADDQTKADYLKKTLLGTETKDINKGLDPADRSMLIEHKLQSEQQRKKWLEDNTNAAGYYTAKYNNLQANGVLTSDDDNLQNKKGAKYQMIRAQVDQQLGADQSLKQLYDDTSESEWRAMIDPESDSYDPDTAGRLMQYDEYRTNAGVSGKSSDSSKRKFTEKNKGGKGGKGGRGGSSDKFVFAQLPASLVGNNANNGSKGYAEDAPTFKPVADLKAPEPKEIPKGRTISIKRGRQI